MDDSLLGKILAEIERQPNITQKLLAEHLGVGFYTIKEYIGKLKKQNRIVRKGGTYGGYWEINSGVNR